MINLKGKLRVVSNLFDSLGSLVNPSTSDNQTNGLQKSQIVDADGSICTVFHGGITTQAYLQAIAEGIITNHTLWSKLGYSPSSSTSQTTLWNLATEYVFPATTISVEAVSTSANDTANGSGAKTIMLHYLDINYVEKDFIFTMNGVTPVTGPTDFFRVNSFHVKTGTRAVGTISLKIVGNSTVYGQIPLGSTRSRNSVYTVPFGKTLYVQDALFSTSFSSAGRAQRMTLHASKDPMGTISTNGLIFWPQFEVMLMDNNASYTKTGPMVFQSTTDLKVSVIGENGAMCTSEISGWIES